jgi:hypothetical protein
LAHLIPAGTVIGVGTPIASSDLEIPMCSLRKTPHAAVFAIVWMLSYASAASASDHLDAPTLIADPAADIGDLYAWTAPDGRRLNLVLDIVGRQFSDSIQYAIHIDSGRRVGKSTATTSILCTFDSNGVAECWAGDTEHLSGEADKETGITSAGGALRVFAGVRNDPFFNNVKGTRFAYDAAKAAIERGSVSDPAGCFTFDRDVSAEILDRWRHTEGGPAQDFLAGWATNALVVSIDIGLVNRGGPLLGVWGATYAVPAEVASTQGKFPELGKPLDRVGRTLTGNALIGPLAAAEVSSRRKEQYNRAAPADWPQFSSDIQHTLGLYDAFDGVCGNQWLADARAAPSLRYHALAQLLADDRLWVDSRSKLCTRYLAVELNATGAKNSDCGGRTPNYDAIDVYRSLLVNGSEQGVNDGVEQDEKVHSSAVFPFLADP